MESIGKSLFAKLKKMFSQEILDRIWDKSETLEGMDSSSFRKDPCGAIISRDQYGLSSAPFGWGVDHIFPLEKGGDDQLDNLRAMHIQNIVAKGTSYPIYESAVTKGVADNKIFVTQFKVQDDLMKRLKELYPEAII